MKIGAGPREDVRLARLFADVAAGFYVANVLDAAVRRGPVRFEETGPGGVEPRFASSMTPGRRRAARQARSARADR